MYDIKLCAKGQRTESQNNNNNSKRVRQISKKQSYLFLKLLDINLEACDVSHLVEMIRGGTGGGGV